MTQNAFEKLTEKYGRCEADQPDPAQPEEQPVLKRWQDSESIKMLSALLKEFGNDQGITLVQTRDGRPVLNFDPGLGAEEKDPERYSVAEHAAYLMDNARKDLEQLIFGGVLTLQEYKGVWL